MTAQEEARAIAQAINEWSEARRQPGYSGPTLPEWLHKHVVAPVAARLAQAEAQRDKSHRLANANAVLADDHETERDEARAELAETKAALRAALTGLTPPGKPTYEALEEHVADLVQENGVVRGHLAQAEAERDEALHKAAALADQLADAREDHHDTVEQANAKLEAVWKRVRSVEGELDAARARADALEAERDRAWAKVDEERSKWRGPYDRMARRAASLQAQAQRYRLAWLSAARGRRRAQQVIAEMPCGWCDGTGIAPADRFGRDEDGAPYQDLDQPCPEGCEVRPDIAVLKGDVADLEAERDVLADRVAALQSPDAHKIADVQRIVELEAQLAQAVVLPADWREQAVEMAAEGVHDAWMAAKREQGFTSRTAEDGEELDEADAISRGLITQPATSKAADCGHCYRCLAPTFGPLGPDRMILCHECGNKRCPHATDHHNPCTGSNEPGQRGSRYGVPPGPQPKPNAGLRSVIDRALTRPGYLVTDGDAKAARGTQPAPKEQQ